VPTLQDFRTPSTDFLHDMMSRVNALGSRPRIIIELDKMVYVPGLKKRYDIVNLINKERIDNVTTFSGDSTQVVPVPPVIPLEGKNTLADCTITSRHRSVNPERPTHKGLDLALHTGDPVVAAWEGTVALSNFQPAGYGNVVYIDHGNGITTRYGHLSERLVAEGDKVTAGQRIGLGGSTGDSSGPHLHFEVRKDGEDLNPEPILNNEANVITKTISTLGVSTTQIETTHYSTVSNVSLSRNFTDDPNGSDIFGNIVGGEAFSANVYSATAGFRTLFGFSGLSFTFDRQWFEDGMLEIGYYTNLDNTNQLVRIKMDDKTVIDIRGGTISGNNGMNFPPPINVPQGKHTFEFSMVASSNASAVWGLTHIKVVEFSQVLAKTNGARDYSLKDIVWAFQDDMNDAGNWNAFGSTTLDSPEGSGFVSFAGGADAAGFERQGIVSFPIVIKANLQVSPDCSGAQLLISNGSVVFSPTFKQDRVEGNNGLNGMSVTTYTVDNKTWQSYLIVIHDESRMTLYIKTDGKWIDTLIVETPEPYTAANMLLFYMPTVSTGSLYVDELDYAFIDYSFPNENFGDPNLLEIGGFVFEETFYLEEDIMHWEIDGSTDAASATASITLNNSKGIFSPNYSLSNFMATAKEVSPMTYWEEGAVRHVLSEGTPIRIYVGYGENIVRRFTGKIKGEISQDSQERTVTFRCVDRYDVVDNTILYQDISFPPQENFDGDMPVTAWLKSSIVQALAVQAGMTGWRYNQEDVQYPDLVIHDTYYIDINPSAKTVIKFDEYGRPQAVQLDSIRTQGGYLNPFVTMVRFTKGEKISDCLAYATNDINFRTYCDWYGTFRLEKIDITQNNAKWEFVDGDNMIGFQPTEDYSRVRNHIIIEGSHGNQMHFFDKDLLIAVKGEIRTTILAMPWIDESDGVSAAGAKKVVADKLFFDMKRQARTRSLVIRGNPLIDIYDGAYIFDSATSTSGYYIVKSNKLVGDEKGMVNMIEVTWGEAVQ
jgi:hypothetical protein